MITENLGILDTVIRPKYENLQVWRTKVFHRKMMKRHFDWHKYHQRSKTETIFSVIKRMLGEHIMARHIVTQNREAVFTDEQLRAQILHYLWNQGSWSEIYTNLDKMKNRLSNVVKNNGKNVMKKVEDLVKWNWILPRKNWETVSLNPIYKPQIKQYIRDNLAG